MQHLFQNNLRTDKSKKQYSVDKGKQLPLELKKFSQDLAKVASQIAQSHYPLKRSPSAGTIHMEHTEGEGVGGYWSSPEDNSIGFLLGDLSSESSPEDGPKGPPPVYGSKSEADLDTEPLSTSQEN